MASSSSMAKRISSSASIVFFLLILLQIPLFRLPCRCGICTSPIQVTSSQLIAGKILPVDVVKVLLYPGDSLVAFLKETRFSKCHRGLLDECRMENVKVHPRASISYDVRQLEILIGSYLSVCGAFLGLLKRGRMSLFGVLLISWGLVREVIRGRGGSGASIVQIYPISMMVVFIVAFLCVRNDVKKIVRGFRGDCTRMGLKKSSKTKYV